MTLREKVWDLVEAHDHDFDGRRELDWLDRLTIALILANVAAIVFRTEPSVIAVAGPFLFWFQWASVVYFTIEYGVRIWACTADSEHPRPIVDRLRFMTSFMGIVDLLAVAPFYLPLLVRDIDPRLIEALMLFRLFWLLKLGRYSNTVAHMDDVVRSKRKELSAAFALVGVLIILAAAGMWLFEKDVQPDKFGTILLSMWWSVVTLTTIGYGDVFPITTGGRIFASLVALAGIGMIALPAGILASAFSSEFAKARARDAAPDACPECGRPVEPE